MIKKIQISSSTAVLALFLLFTLLTGCSTPTASPATPPAADSSGATVGTAAPGTSYPSPFTGNRADPSYPEPTPYTIDPPAYPLPTIQKNEGTPVDVVPFKIDRPVLPTATEVTGTGPAGIPIALADVSDMGLILAETTIDSDGTFTFTLPQPLVDGNRIGIGLGDLTGTQWVADNFSDPGFEGEEPMLVPLEGYFFDTYLVGS